MAKKQNPPVVIDTSDTSPADLGDGWKLVFQRSSKDPKKVRAVIKQPDGTIWARGDVVDENDSFASRLSALCKSRDKNYNLMHGLPADATREDQLKNLEEAIKREFGGRGLGW